MRIDEILAPSDGAILEFGEGDVRQFVQVVGDMVVVEENDHGDKTSLEFSLADLQRAAQQLLDKGQYEKDPYDGFIKAVKNLSVEITDSVSLFVETYDPKGECRLNITN